MTASLTKNRTDLTLAEVVADRWLAHAPKPANYTTDLVLESLLDLAAATGLARFVHAAREILRRRGHRPGGEIPFEHEPFTNLSFEWIRNSPDPRLLAPFVRQSRLARSRTRRSPDGLILHPPEDACGMVLIDATQAYAARMARAGWVSGERCFFDDAAEQLLRVGAVLVDPASGLWRHSRSADGCVNLFAWSRAQGWALRGLVETLRYLPAAHASHGDLVALLRASLAALGRQQTAAGGWRLLVDCEQTQPETSGTAMIVRAAEVAIGQGWLGQEEFADLRSRAKRWLGEVVKHTGRVRFGCQGTGPLETLDDWRAIELRDDEPHAVAAVIAAFCSIPKRS